jgi:hypothetical protein
MENVWSHLYAKELVISAEDHPLLLTETPINPRKNRSPLLSSSLISTLRPLSYFFLTILMFTSRERAAEILFERFNIPALFISNQVVMTLPTSTRFLRRLCRCFHGHHARPFSGMPLPLRSHNATSVTEPRHSAHLPPSFTIAQAALSLHASGRTKHSHDSKRSTGLSAYAHDIDRRRCRSTRAGGPRAWCSTAATARATPVRLQRCARAAPVRVLLERSTYPPSNP